MTRRGCWTPWIRSMRYVTGLHDPEGLRVDLLRLLRIAHTLVNGAGLMVRAHDEPFVDQIADVIDQIDRYVADRLAIGDVLQPLGALRPDGTDCFNGGRAARRLARMFAGKPYVLLDANQALPAGRHIVIPSPLIWARADMSWCFSDC